jgi:hypothetical protein
MDLLIGSAVVAVGWKNDLSPVDREGLEFDAENDARYALSLPSRFPCRTH